MSNLKITAVLINTPVLGVNDKVLSIGINENGSQSPQSKNIELTPEEKLKVDEVISIIKNKFI